MSKSHSPTPVPHLSQPSTPPSRTTSPTPTSTPPSLSFQHSGDSVQHPTMARILHRPSQPNTSVAYASTSSNSQVYPEAGDRGDRPPAAPPSSAPTKKKRTRTLTTPDQAAVLYALLAESRFPSTAVREEVGRSIGLSARKVQIWFQNQRQKARRPPKQNDASHMRSQAASATVAGSSRNPFYCFPNPGSASGTSESPIGTSFDVTAHRGHRPDSPSHLSGPGMPGSDPQFSFHYSEHLTPPSAIPSTSNDALRHSHPSSFSCQNHDRVRPKLSRSPPTDSDSRPATARGLSECRKLPPLVTSHVPTRYSAPPGLLPSFNTRPLSPDIRFVYHTSDAESTALPPPSGLLPLTQQSTGGLSTMASSSIMSDSRRLPPLRSRSPTSTARLLPPSHFSPTRRPTSTCYEDPCTAQSPPPVRAGRYDPVRGTFIVTGPAESQSSHTSTSNTLESSRRVESPPGYKLPFQS